MEETTYNSSSRLISVIERLLSAKLQENFNKDVINLTVEQWKLLFYLWKSDGINQRDLALKSKKEKSTITRQIVELEKKGLIIRLGSTKDKRNKIIHLTEKGKNLEKRTTDIADSITQVTEENIDQDELILFKKILAQMIKNIT